MDDSAKWISRRWCHRKIRYYQVLNSFVLHCAQRTLRDGRRQKRPWSSCTDWHHKALFAAPPCDDTPARHANALHAPTVTDSSVISSRLAAHYITAETWLRIFAPVVTTTFSVAQYRYAVAYQGGGFQTAPEIPKFWQSRTGLQIVRKMFSVPIPTC